jgi:hypothetical protein
MRYSARALLGAVVVAWWASGCGDSEHSATPGPVDSAPPRDAASDASGDTVTIDGREPDAAVGDVGVDAHPEADAGQDVGSNDGAIDGEAGICRGTGPRFVTRVVDHQFGPGQNTGQAEFPAPILGPPRGASAPGVCQGSVHVVSLGNGGYVVLAFDGNAIVDEPGPDFIVFENPFHVGCNPAEPFAELGTVAVSENGVTWVEFPCTASAPPYGACSGWHPVYANPDTNQIDPTDPAVAGGDAYDLSEIGVGIARYVKITDRVDLTGSAGVYDLDAVAIVHPLCP